MLKVWMVVVGILLSTLSTTARAHDGMISPQQWKAWDAFQKPSKRVVKRVKKSTKKVVKKRIQVKRSTPQQRMAEEAPVTRPRETVPPTSTTRTVMLPHPPGCPRRLFCGCGAAVKVFGKPIRHLWLAANWLKFPRAAPAPGMVAARVGHVFVIDRVLPNGLVMAYDYNSGGGRSRYHVRSLRGYSVRNPRG